MQETRVQCLGLEDPLEKEMATHFSILAWRISWTEEPGRLQSMGLQRVGDDWVTNTHKGSGGDQRCVIDLESHFICSRWSCLPSENLALWVKIMFPSNGTAIVKCIFAKNGMVGEFWIMKSWHYRIIQEMNFFCLQDWKWMWKSLSCVQLFATPWTIQSMEISRPEYWSG